MASKFTWPTKVVSDQIAARRAIAPSRAKGSFDQSRHPLLSMRHESGTIPRHRGATDRGGNNSAWLLRTTCGVSCSACFSWAMWCAVWLNFKQRLCMTINWAGWKLVSCWGTQFLLLGDETGAVTVMFGLYQDGSQAFLMKPPMLQCVCISTSR